jgi:hypothetical protein
VRPARALAAVVAGLLLTACGLPVQRGVQSVGPVAPERTVRGDIQVLPPGPRPGADAREIVLGFLGAQTSGDGGHALAREFLDRTITASWDDRAGVVVYDPATLDVVPSSDDNSLVTVRVHTVAAIGADGGYVLSPGTTEDVYRVRRDDRGQQRLITVPSGLRLTPTGEGRSFRPRDVYFLAPPTTARPSSQLVPDRVLLPLGAGPDDLVRAVLAGPTSALRGAVGSALPAGSQLRRPSSTADGAVTVDLTGSGLARMPTATRRQVSAQLVWTLLEALTGVSKVRVLVDGKPLPVPDAGPLQDRSDWADFDPDGSSGRGPALFVADRRLARLDGTQQRSEVSDGRVPVDALASSPSSGRVAVLTRGAGTAAVRVGSASGPFAPVLQRPGVTSLSWGSGDRGLWVVADGAGGRELLLVPDVPTPVATAVAYTAPVGAGDLQSVRVSRDGARVAAVFGEGTARRLFVGRVEAQAGVVRLAGLTSVAPSLADVADVAWESGTSLVALAPLGTPNRLPVRVSVDGSSIEPVRTLGLDGEPETVAAAPDRPLVVGAVVDGRPVLLVEDNGLFRLQGGSGGGPAYPG